MKKAFYLLIQTTLFQNQAVAVRLAILLMIKVVQVTWMKFKMLLLVSVTLHLQLVVKSCLKVKCKVLFIIKGLDRMVSKLYLILKQAFKNFLILILARLIIIKLAFHFLLMIWQVVSI